MSGAASVRSFARELRRRKVWHVLVAYVSVGVAVALAFAELYDDAGLPEWTTRFVLILLLLGLPVALVLAWAYELRPEEAPAVGEPPGNPPTAVPDALADVSAETSERSIVVLPFDNLSPDPGDAYFSDGLTEEIITNLSFLRGLRVISRNSAMVLKGTGKDTRTIGRELDVHYVLEGSVRKAGDALRITAQLIDARTDAHVWAERYDGVFGDVFTIQEQVSRSICDALHLCLTSAEDQRLRERRIDNLPAYECYLKAVVAVWEMTPEGLGRAVRHLEEALEILGPNSYVYVGLAFTHWQRVNLGLAHEEGIRLTDEYVAKALELDPRSSMAWAVRGARELALGGDVRAAVTSLSRALREDPNEPLALVFKAVAYIWLLGRPEAGKPLVERLWSVDPLTPSNYALRAFLPFFQGGYREAAEAWGRVDRSMPETPMFEFYYAWALAYHGDSDRALRILDRPVRCGGDDVGSLFCRILYHALRRDRKSALAELTPDLRRTVARDGTWAHQVASPLAYVGATDEALAVLRQAVDAGFVNYPMMAELDPFLTLLRGDRRYEALLQEVEVAWKSFEEMGDE